MSKPSRGCRGQYRQALLDNLDTLLEKTGAEQKDTWNGYYGEEGRRIIILTVTACVQVRAVSLQV